MIAYAGVGKGSIEAVWSGPVDSIAYDEEGAVAKIRALALLDTWCEPTAASA